MATHGSRSRPLSISGTNLAGKASGGGGPMNNRGPRNVAINAPVAMAVGRRSDDRTRQSLLLLENVLCGWWGSGSKVLSWTVTSHLVGRGRVINLAARSRWWPSWLAPRGLQLRLKFVSGCGRVGWMAVMVLWKIIFLLRINFKD